MKVSQLKPLLLEAAEWKQRSRSRENGRIRQEANTSNLLKDMAEAIDPYSNGHGLCGTSNTLSVRD
jgi:hypothetical protein